MIRRDFRSCDHDSCEHPLGFASRRTPPRGDSLGGLRVSITARRPPRRMRRMPCLYCAAPALEMRLVQALQIDAHRASRPSQLRGGWFALAASVLLALLVGTLWLGAPPASLAADVVAHMAKEPQAWARTDLPAPAPKLDAVLAEARPIFPRWSASRRASSTRSSGSGNRRPADMTQLDNTKRGRGLTQHYASRRARESQKELHCRADVARNPRSV